MTDLLTIQSLQAGFGANTVLHGVDLTVREGEVAALLGLNGAGKSVTLKVVAGLVPAWEGTVHFHGSDITGLTPEKRVARGMSHITQGRQLFPELSVEENLRIGAYVVRRRDRAAYPALLDSAFTRFPRLAERRTQLAGTLSGGEQAMLAVARALMAAPSLVLVDEPSAGLSPRAAAEVLETLRAVQATGVTLLLVEQNVAFALALADTVHVMRRGQIVHCAPAAELDRDILAAELGIGRLLAKGASLVAAAPRRRRRRRAHPLVARREPSANGRGRSRRSSKP